MDDLISRQSVINIFLYFNANQWLEMIKKLPSAQQWIPVSERLPDVMGFDERYLVSLAWGGVGVMEYKSTGFHNYGSFSPVPIGTVTAWMPLPEPWKGEEG